MPFCSRRTWKTPAGVPTWPTPGCYDDNVVLPRCQSRYSDRKTAGVYHDNHPHTAADAALRGLLLSRLNRVRWPTFIPALTPIMAKFVITIGVLLDQNGTGRVRAVPPTMSRGCRSHAAGRKSVCRRFSPSLGRSCAP